MMSLSPICLVGNRIFDHTRRDVGRLRKRRRRPELGGHPHNYVLQSRAAQAYIGSSRKDALETLARVARWAESRCIPTHSFLFQPGDPRPAVARTQGEALWRRYRRALTLHAARAHRQTAMRRAAAETIAEYLVEKHGLGRGDEPAGRPDRHAWRIPAGLEQLWRIEPLLRLYHRLS